MQRRGRAAHMAPCLDTHHSYSPSGKPPPVSYPYPENPNRTKSVLDTPLHKMRRCTMRCWKRAPCNKQCDGRLAARIPSRLHGAAAGAWTCHTVRMELDGLTSYMTPMPFRAGRRSRVLGHSCCAPVQAMASTASLSSSSLPLSSYRQYPANSHMVSAL